MRYFEALDDARSLRKQQTDAEIYFWNKVRNRKLGGLKFNRQFLIEYSNILNNKLYYIADFHNFEHNLIIEIDGKIHEFQKEYDIMRQMDIEAMGYKVLRFENSDVLYEWDKVEKIIIQSIQ